jgi:ABC-type transport system involved in cytochrome bd biosynthesis fused ATPase/permease subunit
MTHLTILEAKMGSGKTTAIKNLKKDLVVNQGYIEKINKSIDHRQWDYQFLLIKGNKVIILQSGMDNFALINKFKEFAETQLQAYQDFDIMVIIPCRDDNNPRIKNATIELCEDLSTSIKTFFVLPTDIHFNYKNILPHLSSLGF